MNAAQLLTHFDRLAEAPGAVPRLRRFILDLAVRGKLVEQDAGDEPAAALLARIRATAVKNAKGKRLADEPKGVSQETFSLPAEWTWTRLGDVAQYGTPDKADATSVLAAKTWVLDLEDIEKDTSRLLARIESEARPFSSTKTVFKRGDVLFGKLRPYLNKVIVADRVGVCTTEIIPIRGHCGLVPEYTQLVLRSSLTMSRVDQLMYGVKMPRLGTADATALAYPLPPLAEQHRIVAKVDELMALCDQLEAAQQERERCRDRLAAASLQRLNQPAEANPATDQTEPAEARQQAQREQQKDHARFHLQNLNRLTIRPEHIKAMRQTLLNLAIRGALTREDGKGEPVSSASVRKALKPYEIGSSWRWVRMDEIVKFFGGSQPPKDTFVFQPREGYTRLIQIRDFKSDAHMTFVPNEKANRPFTQHDVMIGRYGPPVFQILRGLAGTHNVALMKAVPLTQELGNDFLFYLLRETRIHDTVVRESERTAGQTGIRLPLLNSFVVGLPPLAEQHRTSPKSMNSWPCATSLKPSSRKAKPTAAACWRRCSTPRSLPLNRRYGHARRSGKRETITPARVSPAPRRHGLSGRVNLLLRGKVSSSHQVDLRNPRRVPPAFERCAKE